MTIKHVGAKHYNTYFKLVDFSLKSRDATVVPLFQNRGSPVISAFLLEHFFLRFF